MQIFLKLGLLLYIFPCRMLASPEHSLKILNLAKLSRAPQHMWSQVRRTVLYMPNLWSFVTNWKFMTMVFLEKYADKISCEVFWEIFKLVPCLITSTGVVPQRTTTLKTYLYNQGSITKIQEFFFVFYKTPFTSHRS